MPEARVFLKMMNPFPHYPFCHKDNLQSKVFSFALLRSAIRSADLHQIQCDVKCSVEAGGECQAFQWWQVIIAASKNECNHD